MCRVIGTRCALCVVGGCCCHRVLLLPVILLTVNGARRRAYHLRLPAAGIAVDISPRRAVLSWPCALIRLASNRDTIECPRRAHLWLLMRDAERDCRALPMKWRFGVFFCSLRCRLSSRRKDQALLRSSSSGRSDEVAVSKVRGPILRLLNRAFSPSAVVINTRSHGVFWR